VVSGLKDILNNDRIEAIAWYREKETGLGDFGRPCGNCRDILKQYCDPNLILLNGNENAVVYTRLKDFLFEDFRKIDASKIGTRFVNAGLSAMQGGNDVYLPDKMKSEVYGAVLIAENGWAWPGSHYTNVGYDSVTPVVSAIISWRNSYPKGTIEEDRLRLSRLLIVGEKQMPHVFYRDRQAILENDEVLRRFTKNSLPLKVQIVQVDGEAYETNVEEWLPHPFSPGAFRMDDVMQAQLENLTGKR